MEFLISHPDYRIGSVAQKTEENKGWLHKDLQSIEDYVKLVLFKSELTYNGQSREALREEAGLIAKRLKENYKKRKGQELTKMIEEAEERGDQDAAHKLLVEFNKLIKQEGDA